MPNEITPAVKEKYPAYKDIPDSELTLLIGRRYPQYLKDDGFRLDFESIANEVDLAPAIYAPPLREGTLTERPPGKTLVEMATDPLFELAKKVDDKALADAMDVAALSIGQAEGGLIDGMTLGEFREALGSQSREPTVVEKTAAGVQQSVADTVNFFTSPLGASTLGIGAFPAAVQKTIAGLFTVHMISETPETYRKLKKSIKEGDAEAIGRNVTDALTEGLFIYKGGKHMLKGKKTAQVEALAKMLEREAGIDYIRHLENPDKPIVFGDRSTVLQPRSRAELTESLAELGRVSAEPFLFYSERLINTLERKSNGGPASMEFANTARLLVDSHKRRHGEVSVKSVDEALKLTGEKNKGTTWLNTIDWAPGKNYGVHNFFRAEKNKALVPEYAREAQKAADKANKDIGNLVKDFEAVGKYQRMWTPAAVDMIRHQKGPKVEFSKESPAFRAWIEGFAELNNESIAETRDIFWGLKSQMTTPGSARTIRQVSQEFNRVFEKSPTAVRIKNPGIMPDMVIDVLHAKPFNYLQTALDRVSMRAAFLEAFPTNPKPGVIRFDEFRNRAARELGGEVEHFDRVARALHGLPVDDPAMLKVFRPGSRLDLTIGRFYSEVMAQASALKLTASSLWNAVESVAGGAPQFAGVTTYLRGLARAMTKGGRQEVERIGAVNQLMYDWSTDPNHRVGNFFRKLRQHVKQKTGQNVLNEWQEKAAATTAQVLTEDAAAGRLGESGKSKMEAWARAMDFTKEQAHKMAEGTASDALYDSFVVRSPAFLSGGNLAPAELSRFGGSRTLTSQFRFQTYPMVKMNQITKLSQGLLDAVKSGDKVAIDGNARLLSRYLFGTAGQGAGIIFLKAFIPGGLDGLDVKKNEIVDDFGAFLKDALLNGIGGPLQTMDYALGGSGVTGRVIEKAPETIARSTLPYSVVTEISQAAAGTGKYKDMAPMDVWAKFATDFAPGYKAGRGIAALIGLGESDTALKAAEGGLRRWRKDVFGSRYLVDESTEGLNEFKAEMRKATEEIKAGKDPWDSLITALQIEDMPDPTIDPDTGEVDYGIDGREKVSSSLKGRKLLVDLNRKKLSIEQREALIRRIGQKHYDKLAMHDAMLDVLANTVMQLPQIPQQ